MWLQIERPPSSALIVAWRATREADSGSACHPLIDAILTRTVLPRISQVDPARDDRRPHNVCYQGGRSRPVVRVLVC